MKKTLFAMAAATLMLAGCGSTNNQWGQLGGAVLGNVLGQATGTEVNPDAMGNILTSVLGGASTPTQKDLVGTWKYYQPGCAFTSDQLLAQAGGELVAAEIKSKLSPSFQKVGIKSGNTQVTFNQDGTFSAKIAGKSWNGNYTYDEKTAKITMQGLLLNMNCYAKKSNAGLSLLFESSKLLTLLQTMSALSGNAQVQAVGDIAKSYNGLRIGFDMK
ncbi:MAG: DUF4923 family protein [Prevotella sp.]|nr:DUF4923 family protein [Prevotella sp.]